MADDVIFDEFHSKIEGIGVVPKIHSFILNKARTQNSRSAKAYLAHVDSIKKVTKQCVKNHPDRFSDDPQVYDIKDCNTIAPVIHFHGLPPLGLLQKPYQVYDATAQVNKSQIEPFLDDLNKVVDSIE